MMLEKVSKEIFPKKSKENLLTILKEAAVAYFVKTAAGADPNFKYIQEKLVCSCNLDHEGWKHVGTLAIAKWKILYMNPVQWTCCIKLFETTCVSRS